MATSYTIIFACILANVVLVQPHVITYYVKPDGGTLCPAMPCLTFAEYAENATLNLELDSTFIFLPGNHSLNGDFVAANLSSLILSGLELTSLPQAHFVCTSPAGLTFENISRVEINNLAFSSCGRPGTDFSIPNAILVNSVEDFVLNSTLLHSSVTSALLLYLSNARIDNCSFDDTTGGTFGSVLIVDSVVSFVNNTFANNLAINQGGALHAERSALEFSGKNIFEKNSAGRFGGASYLLQSNATFYGSTCFVSNMAQVFGGAMFATESMLTFVDNVTFESNYGPFVGGGIEASHTVLVSSSNSYCTFVNNSAMRFGGGAYLDESIVEFSGFTTFTGNTVHASGAGGAVDSYITTLTFNGTSIFSGNSVRGQGGGLYVGQSTLTFDGTSLFTNNSASISGGGIEVFESTVVLGGSASFVSNAAFVLGGGMRASMSNVTTCGSTNFVNNSASTSAGLITYNCSVIVLGNTQFISNFANASGGGGLAIFFGSFNMSGNAIFQSNSAPYGAAAYLAVCLASFSGCTHFVSNSGAFQGGCVYAHNSTVNFAGNSTFTDSSAAIQGSGIYARGSMLSFEGNTTLAGNTDTAAVEGTLYANRSIVQFSGYTNFTANSAYVGGGIYADSSSLSFKGHTYFFDNKADKGGGGIHGKATGIIMHAPASNETATFSLVNNSANQGGGISLEQNSAIFLYPPLHLYFRNNSATEGGAIFVRDIFTLSDCSTEPGTNEQIVDPILLVGQGALDQQDSDCNCNSNVCFLQLEEFISTENTELVFINNSASVAGSVLYGGKLESCQFMTGFQHEGSPLEVFMNLSTITAMGSSSIISSDPTGICFLSSGETSCDTFSVSVSHGQKFILSAVAVGQARGSVPALIRSYFGSGSGGHAAIGENQLIQQTGKNFTNLEYRVFSPDGSEDLILYPEGPCRDLGIARRSVSVHLEPCPDGFQLSNSQCICEERLQAFTNSCNVDDETMLRSSNFWMSGLYMNGSYQGLILHPRCPFDYCLTTVLSLTPSDPNAQCASDRTGTLCGSCSKNFSVAFGSSRCLQCRNTYLSLLIPFAMAGIVLVVFLLALKLTVSVRTINGLIFYANIVAVNRAIFFPPGANNILTVFIAWVNLDLGIETCFYDGMDAYARTWLQFVFPFYLWLLTAMIILASHCSLRLSKYLGTNPVSVLATLFLLSYAKLLRTIISAFRNTFLEYPDGSQVSVWLLDGNIRYLTTKHIPLFLAALATLLFLFLPYTLFLLLGQWMLSWSDKKVLSWVSKPTVKTLLDTYYGPYQDKHRYWTGLLLLLRGVMFVTFAFNILGDPSVDLLCITTASLGITMVTRMTGKIYKKLWLDVLEASFILNLGILAAATYHVRLAGGSQGALSYLSVSIALVTFFGILLYHIYLQTHSATFWKRLPKPNFQICWVSTPTDNNGHNPIRNETETDPNPHTASDRELVATTYVEFREPLLEDAPRK